MQTQTQIKGYSTTTDITMMKNKRMVALNNNNNNNNKQQTDAAGSAFGDDEDGGYYDATATENKNNSKPLSSSRRGRHWPFRKAGRGDAITLPTTAPVGSIEIPAAASSTSGKSNPRPRRSSSRGRRSSHMSFDDSSRRRKRRSSKTYSTTSEEEEDLKNIRATIRLMREDSNSIVDNTRDEEEEDVIIGGSEDDDVCCVSDNNDGDNDDTERYCKGQNGTRRATPTAGGEIQHDLTCGLAAAAAGGGGASSSLADCCGGTTPMMSADGGAPAVPSASGQHVTTAGGVLSTWLLDPAEFCCSMLTRMLEGAGQQKVCLHCLEPVNLFTQKASVRTGYPYSDRRHRDHYLHQEKGCEAERTHMEILMNDVLDELEAIFYFVRQEEEGSERNRTTSGRNTTRIVAYEPPKNPLLRAASPQKWGISIIQKTFRVGRKKDDSSYLSSRRMRGSTAYSRRTR